MASRQELRDIPAYKVDEVIAGLERVGVRDIRQIAQADGRFALSFLPGDSDFPIEADAPKHPDHPKGKSRRRR